MAVALFDPWAQSTLDLSHDLILTNLTPPTLVADRVTHSTIRSVYYVHWNTIACGIISAPKSFSIGTTSLKSINKPM